MGEIKVRAELENAVDREVVQRGLSKELEVRTHAVEATVDTGAVMMVLPQDAVEKLGLKHQRTVIVTYADERCARNEEFTMFNAICGCICSGGTSVARVAPGPPRGGKVKEAQALDATTAASPWLQSRNRARLDLV